MKEWRTNNETYGSSYGRSNSLPKKIIGKSTAHYLQSLDKGNFIREEQNIAKRERHGLFTQPLGLAPGDPYKDPEIKQPSKRFQVNQRLQQKVAPEVFSNPGTINLHDPYKDPFRANQLYIKEKGDLSIHDRAFVAGGKQKLIKHAQFEYVKEFNDKQFHTRDENGKVITSKKNLYTNKMRKGYGSIGVEHLFSSYPYEGYPEEDGRKKDQQEKMAHKAKIATPFKSTSHPNTTFTNDHAIYNKDEPYQEKKEDLTYREKSLNQWRYNNPNKKGYHGTFSDFPPYIEQGEREKNQIQTTKPWMFSFIQIQTKLQWNKQRSRINFKQAMHPFEPDDDERNKKSRGMIDLLNQLSNIHESMIKTISNVNINYSKKQIEIKQIEQNMLEGFVEIARPQLTVEEFYAKLRKHDKTRRTFHHESHYNQKQINNGDIKIVSPFSSHEKKESNKIIVRYKREENSSFQKKNTGYLRKKEGLQSLQQIAKRNYLIKKQQKLEEKRKFSSLKKNLIQQNPKRQPFKKGKCQPLCGLFKIKCNFCKPGLDCFNTEFQKFLRQNDLWILSGLKGKTREADQAIKQEIISQIINYYTEKLQDLSKPLPSKAVAHTLKKKIQEKIQEKAVSGFAKRQLFKWFEKIYLRFQAQIKKKRPNERIKCSLKDILDRLREAQGRQKESSRSSKKKKPSRYQKTKQFRHSAEQINLKDLQSTKKLTRKKKGANSFINQRQKNSVIKTKQKRIQQKKKNEILQSEQSKRLSSAYDYLNKKIGHHEDDKFLKHSSKLKKQKSFIDNDEYSKNYESSQTAEKDGKEIHFQFLDIKKKKIQKRAIQVHEFQNGLDFPQNFQQLIDLNENSKSKIKRRLGVLKLRRMSKETAQLNILRLKIEENKKIVSKIQSHLQAQGFSHLIIRDDDCNLTRLRKIHYLKGFTPPPELSIVFKKYIHIIEQHQQAQSKKYQKYLKNDAGKEKPSDLRNSIENDALFCSRDYLRGLLFYDLVKTEQIPNFYENTNYLKQMFKEQQIEMECWVKEREQLEARNKLEDILFAPDQQIYEQSPKQDTTLIQKDLGKLIIQDNLGITEAEDI